MIVKYGKINLEVSSEDINDHSSISELKEKVIEMIKVSDNYSWDKGDIKMIVSGKIISDDSILIGSLPGGIFCKPTIIATKKNNVVEDNNLQHLYRIKDDLIVKKNNQISNSEKRKYHPSNKYGFQAINVLPGFSDSDKAREILSSLANDPG